MNIARYVLAIALLLMAIAVVVTNWACVIMTIRNKSRGIDQHHSTMTVASILFTFVAYTVYPHADKFWMISIPLLDISKWGLLTLPTVWFRAGRADDTSESKRVRGPDA